MTRTACIVGALAGLVLAAGLPAWAGQGAAPGTVGLGSTADPERGLPLPADTGKPNLFDFSPEAAAPAVSRGDSGGCPPALPCGTRLLGAVRKNGAVLLEVPAMRW